MSNRELNWLLSHPEIEDKYAGEYIAILGEDIIAHGKDFKAVFEQVQKEGAQAFIYKALPTDKELVV